MGVPRPCFGNKPASRTAPHRPGLFLYRQFLARAAACTISGLLAAGPPTPGHRRPGPASSLMETTGNPGPAIVGQFARSRIEESYATPLVSAVRARTARYRGDVPAARQQLVSAQRLRHLLTYALLYFAVQARIELAGVHLALADPQPGPGRWSGRSMSCSGAGLASAAWPAKRRRCGPGCRRSVGQAPRSVGADRCRAAPAAPALHPPVVPGDSCRLVPVPPHRQVAGEVDLPEAGRFLTQPSARPVPGAGSPGGVTAGHSSHWGDEARRGTRWNGGR